MQCSGKHLHSKLPLLNLKIGDWDIKLSTPCPRAKFFFFNLALKEKNMQVKFYLKLSVYSLGLDI